MGNSELVARDHYLQITDEHFAKAAGGGGKQSGAESGAAPAGFASQHVASPRDDKTLTLDSAIANNEMRLDAISCETASMGAVGFDFAGTIANCGGFMTSDIQTSSEHAIYRPA
jgi:hypothetical protein